MRVLIAGAHGKIGQQLVRQMTDSIHQSRAMVRDPDQTPAMEQLGADEVVIGNLEQDCTSALVGCDAVVFTAGSGPDTGPEKTVAVDEKGAMRLIDSAKAAEVKRFVLLSSMGAGDPQQGPEKLRSYLDAKHNADEHLRNSGLAYTIVRPGPLTQEPATGKVEVAEKLGRSGGIPRQDVAQVLLESLDHSNTENCVFEVLSGDVRVPEALEALPGVRH